MIVALHAPVGPAVVLLVARPARRAATLVRRPPFNGEIALALVVVPGVGPSARPRRSEVSPRSHGRLLVGSLLHGLFAGALLSVWRGMPGKRGSASTAALVLLPAAALVVTAVPVPARILTDRAVANTTEDRHRLLLAAVAIDALTRLLLTVAPAAAMATERAGLTAVCGAVPAGLAVPRDGEQGPRARAVRMVERCGLSCVPALFVTVGFRAATDGPDGLSRAALALVLVLATAATLGGGHAGARAARLPVVTALRFAAPAALVTMAATGPRLSWADHRGPATGVLPSRVRGAVQ